MKIDMTTAIVTAIIGVILAYFITNNFILGTPTSVTIKSLESAIDPTLAEPSPEVFNYRALNPAEESYVGSDCQNYDIANNVCLDNTDNTDDTDEDEEGTDNEDTGEE